MIGSYTQLLGRRYKGRLDADADEFIDYAVNGAARMKRLINNILDYARVQSRGGAFTPTDCNQLVGSVLADLQLAINETQAQVTIDRLPVVEADASQLQRVFENLIANALKFRREEPPRIHVSAERSDEDWVFTVQDNGIGIEEEYADRIFVIFERLHTEDKYTGTGIGLALCRRMIRRHGGDIWVESTPGVGSSFRFNLPATRRASSGRSERSWTTAIGESLLARAETKDGALGELTLARNSDSPAV